MKDGTSIIIRANRQIDLDKLIKTILRKYNENPIEIIVLVQNYDKSHYQNIQKFATEVFIRQIVISKLSCTFAESEIKTFYSNVHYISNQDDLMKLGLLYEEKQKSEMLGKHVGQSNIDLKDQVSKQPTIKTHSTKYLNAPCNYHVSMQKRNYSCDIVTLKKEYKEKGLDKISDSFVLYRILGNDLYPRHKKGQSRENLKFILENELEFENCEKIFVVNRIIDEKEEYAIIDLLKYHQRQYIHIPFRPDEYIKISWDTDCLPESGFLASKTFENLGPEKKARVLGAIYRRKNNYVMHNNAARNIALRDGKKRGKWVLPWDGNCFITTSAWKQIRTDILSNPYLKYFIVPMARITDNNLLLSDDFSPEPSEEPQLIFRNDALEEFNEEFCYGRRPKVEMFWRLGVPGKWDLWKDDPWDMQRRPLSPEAGQFGVAGWVARLSSGMESLEKDSYHSFRQRGLVRLEAICETLQNVDIMISGMSPDKLTSICPHVLENERKKYSSSKNSSLFALVKKLISYAEDALTRGPYSVVDKTTLPPSGNPNDYWHPAPYWWPNPNTQDGLPYIRKDGERVSGTRMYESGSEKYDRSRMQRVFDDTTVLSMAWYFTGNIKYANHGHKIIQRFFVDPETRMNPNLKYAQVRMGHNNNIGYCHGIIEMKDMYYFLDAVRLINKSGAISKKTMKAFVSWLYAYLDWVLDSPQGKKERKAKNNHGTYYDLQVASIASFLGEYSTLFEALARANSRIPLQFASDGSQPEEINRTITAHYCCFNFQGWINLAEIAYRWGVDFWSYTAPNSASLRKGAQWLISQMNKTWPYKQIEEFDNERLFPILLSIPREIRHAIYPDINVTSKYGIKSKFYPHDGIRPFWNLGLADKHYQKNINSNQKSTSECLDKKSISTNEDVEKIKIKLLNLGFTDSPIKELSEIALQSSYIDAKKIAAWELARWYANQPTPEGAKQSLKWIYKVIEKQDNVNKKRLATILEVESLERLGKLSAAKESISKMLTAAPHANLYLAAANLETSLTKRLECINIALKKYHITPISIDLSSGKKPYDSLIVKQKKQKCLELDDFSTKVSVIIPAYNAENTIDTTIKSIISQTWNNIEILIVNDCSTDQTEDLARKYAEQDSRVHILKTETNSGPYVARNIALQKAKGDFVTCNDADDWSHPEKIERQIQHLLENPSVICNMSQQARATSDLRIYRRGNYGYLFFENMSSLLFRRKPILKKLGYWDSVRFAADSEYIQRIKKAFGKDAVAYLSTGPLSFQRQSEDSLTGNQAYGYHGYFMGARKEYREVYKDYHQISNSLFYDFPQYPRPFPVPEPMWPKRETKSDERRWFDVIFVSDFRLEEYIADKNIGDIKYLYEQEQKIGLIQMSLYNYDPNKNTNPQIRKLIDGNKVQMLVYGELLACDLVVVRPPAILEEKQRFIPNVQSKNIILDICNNHINVTQTYTCDISTCKANISEYFGKKANLYKNEIDIKNIFDKYKKVNNTRSNSCSKINISSAHKNNTNKQNKKSSNDKQTHIYKKKNYWDKRSHLMYYKYIDKMVKKLATNCKSIIDVGSGDTPLVERFEWIPYKYTLDLRKPYHSENVTGIKHDFLKYQIQKKYDFVLCLQVLEHVPSAKPFAQKLFDIGHNVLISVPYKWEQGSCKFHIHDPVDLDKMYSWTGREPDYYVIVTEPLKNTRRLICYYH